MSEPPQDSALKKLIEAGTWDPSLSACTWTNASSINKMQRNYKGLKINCTHACTVGANYEQDTKRQKTPAATSEKSETKAWLLYMVHAHSTTKGVSKPPLDQPYPHLYEGPAHLPHPLSGSKQGNPLLGFAPSCCSRSPNKTLPEFLLWPLINFC